MQHYVLLLGLATVTVLFAITSLLEWMLE